MRNVKFYLVKLAYLNLNFWRPNCTMLISKKTEHDKATKFQGKMGIIMIHLHLIAFLKFLISRIHFWRETKNEMKLGQIG